MRTLIFSIIFLFSFTSFAQLKEAYFKYNIEVEAVGKSKEAKQTVAMLRNSNMELYFTENKSRMNFKMGELSMTSVIMDREKDVMLSLSDSYAGKMAMLGKPESSKKEQDPNVKTTSFNEVKTILGYKCTKFVVVENGSTTEYWITKDILIDSKDQGILNSNLPGFPVAFSKVEDDVKMTFQLVNMEKQLKSPASNLFSTVVPEGFTLVKGME